MSKSVVSQLKAKETNIQDVWDQRKALNAELVAKDKEIDPVQVLIDEKNKTMDARGQGGHRGQVSRKERTAQSVPGGQQQILQRDGNIFKEKMMLKVLFVHDLPFFCLFGKFRSFRLLCHFYIYGCSFVRCA